ncbi:GNAT family N-acetyltransferase [Paenibacillus arenilitoris]|uniref:GNAT family N-acetyltransferase n=1 Tax=Paenibacillus arenilitoris TaxID=2772299 RepID=A0A927H460_9BACL|nr:GNAT family N-acetyltransferase [Paenibacillus arenilitoris]MBD2867032.1 GNAT family N-acetyltransferase [Paenibacillus arenilitoris]
MVVEAWDERYARGVIALWNEEAVRDGYKELDADSFNRIFTGNPYFDPGAAFVWLDGRDVAGFACGCTGDDLPLGDKAGYITCIVLRQGHATAANYRSLLDALEARFAELGKTQADVLFFNPMQLPWYIPDTPGHEHNNAPGVPVGSGLHRFLLDEGYAERAVEQAMYLELSGFAPPEDIRLKETAASEQGYAVGVFASGEVGGIAEMLDGLGNPLWTEEIARCAAEGTPVVYAAKDGLAAGFAGPVIRQPNGWGYFAGIGVHPDHEGHGLGTLLFFKLCEAFRAIGTPYMSLYTGSANPAARIYEKAGFRTVKHFAVMRKELFK